MLLRRLRLRTILLAEIVAALQLPAENYLLALPLLTARSFAEEILIKKHDKTPVVQTLGLEQASVVRNTSLYSPINFRFFCKKPAKTAYFATS